MKKFLVFFLIIVFMLGFAGGFGMFDNSDSGIKAVTESVGHVSVSQDIDICVSSVSLAEASFLGYVSVYKLTGIVSTDIQNLFIRAPPV